MSHKVKYIIKLELNVTKISKKKMKNNRILDI